MKKNGEMLCAMIQFAVQKHAGQFDKGGRPYILHPLTVMHRLRTDDEELQCIAVGHDLKEDCGVTNDDLRAIGMTTRVIVGIDHLTHRPNESYEEYKRRVMGNYDAILVKRQDLRHNSDIRRLKGVRPKDLVRIQRYHEFFLELEGL